MAKGRAEPERTRRPSNCPSSSPGWPGPGCRWARAWRRMAEELPSGRLRRSMRDLARGLESGQLLDEAVEGRGGGSRRTCAA